MPAELTGYCEHQRVSFILTINSGSSSIKFALFEMNGSLNRVLAGKFDRIGLSGAALKVVDPKTDKKEERAIQAPDHASCVRPLIELIEERMCNAVLNAIGHRIVHGGPRYREPQRVDAAMLEELQRLSPYDPEHLPSEIALMESLAESYVDVPQIACFDTAFHRELPPVARLLPIPRKYAAKGVQRYGFHGLSYAYLMGELERLAGTEAAHGRVILAHLGNGASMAAVQNGRCMDTTMAFTPAAGLVMSTRSGDIDPGLVAYLARTENMTTEQFHEMINAKSGLLGISEISPDMRDLLEREKADERAAEALAIFCQQAKKWIGALAAVLGGLDTLVFAGGIGENAPVIRARICDGLSFLGIEIDPKRNEASAETITTDNSGATARVIRTDEEIYMAKAVMQLLAKEKSDTRWGI